MQKVALIRMAVLAALAGPAAAGDPHERLLACYEEKMMPPKYHVEKRLVSPVFHKYYRRNGRVELVEIPAVYREIKTEIEPAYKLLVEIPCD